MRRSTGFLASSTLLLGLFLANAAHAQPVLSDAGVEVEVEATASGDLEGDVDVDVAQQAEIAAPVAPPPPEVVAPPPAAPIAPPPAPVVEDDADGDDGWPFQFKASLFSRYELRRNYSLVGLANSDSMRFRGRFGLATDRLDIGSLAVAVRVMPQASGLWNIGGDTLDDPALGLHEGVLEIYGGPVRLEVGRFEMVYGEHFVIGNVDWHPTARAFDGARLRIDTGVPLAFIDAFFTYVDEGAARGLNEPVGSGDVYFAGIYAGFGPHLAEGLALDAYVLGQLAPATDDPVMMTSVDTGARITIGARFKYATGPIDYRAELGVQVGREQAPRDIFAYQGDVEVGVSLLDGALRISGEGLLASGDDPDTAMNEGWNQLYPTAHKFLGLSDIIGGRTNVTGAVAHVQAKLIPEIMVFVDAHFFLRPQDTLIQNPVDPTMPFRRAAGYTATELDFGAGYAFGGGLGTRAQYSLFIPNDSWYPTNQLAHFLEVELRFDY